MRTGFHPDDVQRQPIRRPRALIATSGRAGKHPVCVGYRAASAVRHRPIPGLWRRLPERCAGTYRVDDRVPANPFGSGCGCTCPSHAIHCGTHRVSTHTRRGRRRERSRPLSNHLLDDAEVANEIFDIHRASRRTYGAPRVEGQLRHRGRSHSPKRVARVMAECGLVGAH